MSKFIANWLAAAAEVLAAEFSRPVDLLPGAAVAPGTAHFTLGADITGDWARRFVVSADEAALTALFRTRKRLRSPSEDPAAEDLAGDDPTIGASERDGELTAPEVREAWQRLFGRICAAAATALGVEGAGICEVAMIWPEAAAVGTEGLGYQLSIDEVAVALAIADQVEAAPPKSPTETLTGAPGQNTADPGAPKGLDLLMGVELEASLRFGSREMALNDLLALGPGDVIQLDRALADPVDLIIGDKIVARGEVVLVDGNFGLRVTEFAAPQRSLESIRCLF